MCEVKMLNKKDISTIIIWLTPRNSLLHKVLFDSSPRPRIFSSLTIMTIAGGGGFLSWTRAAPLTPQFHTSFAWMPLHQSDRMKTISFAVSLTRLYKNDSNSAISSPNVAPSKINPDKQAKIIVIIFMIIFTFLLAYCLSPHTRKQAPYGRRTRLSCSLVYPQSLA